MRARLAMWGLLAASCTSAPSAPDAPAPAAVRTPDREPVADPQEELSVLIGIVHDAGDLHCDPQTPDESQWVNPYFQVGFTALKLAGEVAPEISAHVRKPVILHGRPTAASVLERRVEHDATSCVQYQMRSDMVRAPEGIRILRDTAMSANFEPQRVTEFGALEVSGAGESLKFALTNPLHVPLTAPLEVVLHYEGCFGKPGARTVSKSRSGTFESGAIWRFDAPRILEDGRKYRLASAQIIYSDPKVHFDFDAQLSELGVEGVACPRD